MLRSMFAGVSALRNHQLQMDVIGHNIANVNTVGYKSSRVTFQELLSQMLRDATAPHADRGGTNPVQIGLGAYIASVNVLHTPGNLQTTGNPTDVAIHGEGFFVLANGEERFYTRSGMFNLDHEGALISAAGGLKVLGWMADGKGNIDLGSPLSPIVIPRNVTMEPKMTTEIAFAGNLDARVNGTLAYLPSPSAELTDAEGNSVQLRFVLEPTGNFNEFRWKVVTGVGTFSGGSPEGTILLDKDGNVLSVTQVQPGDIILNLGGASDITIRPPQAGQANGGAFSWDTDSDDGLADADGDGLLDDGSSIGIFTPAQQFVTTIDVFDSLGNTREVVTRLVKIGNNAWEWIAEDGQGNVLNTGGVPGTLQFDEKGALLVQSGTISLSVLGGAQAFTVVPDFSRATQYGDVATFVAASQDGFGIGTLTDFTIDASGVVFGSFSNGRSRALAQLAVATFANAAGLRKSGDTLYEVSNNSGEPRIGVAGQGLAGTISAGMLEMSNVDLSQEFTNLIITQRGFQANSRIITTSDELLQELVNLKR